jgi:hypothetical protein
LNDGNNAAVNGAFVIGFALANTASGTFYRLILPL